VIELSLEQRFQLELLRLEAAELEKEELLELLLEEREELLLRGNYFRHRMREAGMEAEGALMDGELVLPDSEEELVAHFGYVPSDEEVAALINDRIEAHQEAARIDVDIEAIVLGVEEQ
jgi:hypothetical protein